MSAHQESIERWLGKLKAIDDDKITPEVLLHDLRIAYEYAKELEESLKTAEF